MAKLPRSFDHFFYCQKPSDAEMSFYYSFFNVIAIQQMLEMGFGFVLKQYIAHAYKHDFTGQWI